MTIQECYEKLGGNFDQVEKLLPNEQVIRKFITKFLDDDSFSELCHAMKEGNREDAFRAAHTLKGVCGNLSFSKLLSSVEQLTELLRQEAENIPEDAFLYMKEVEQDYELTVDAIRVYLESVE